MSDAASAVPAPSVASGKVVAPPSFEQAMERLEEVVGQMENSKLPLEDLIRCYEEGTRLVKVCTERLTAAEQRIEIISREAAGEPPSRDEPPAASEKASVRESLATQNPSGLPSRAAKKNNEVSLF